MITKDHSETTQKTLEDACKTNDLQHRSLDSTDKTNYSGGAFSREFRRLIKVI